MRTQAPEPTTSAPEPRIDARLSNSRTYLPLKPQRRLDRWDAAIMGAIFLGSLALYTATLTRGLNSMSGDSSELVTKSALLQVAHMPGSPLYVWIGKLFTLLPFGQIATRVTWMSSLLAAVAVATLYPICVRFVTRNRLASAGAAALFALSLTFWSQAVIAELYAPNLGFVAPVVWCMLEWAACRSSLPEAANLSNPLNARKWLMSAAFLFGASLGIHLSNLMFLPVFAFFVLLGWPLDREAAAGVLRGVQELDWRGGLAAFGLFMLALTPYLWLATGLESFPASEGKPSSPAGWPLFYDFTLNAYSAWRFSVPPASWPDRAVMVLHLAQRNFGWLAVPFLTAGLLRMLVSRTRLFYLFAGMTLANFVFYGTYRVADIDVFFIPGYWALVPALALGLSYGAQLAAQSIQRWNKIDAVRAALVPLSATILIACGLQWGANFRLNNRTNDVSLRDFYGNVFAGLPEGSWLYGRGASLGYDLLYSTRLYGVRPDIHYVVGPQPGETVPPPWPPGPAYALTVKRDVFLPAFLYDPTGANNKWYSPELLGMFKWEGSVRRGWLSLYKLTPNEAPPLDWLVEKNSPLAKPRKRLDVAITPELTLLGVDMPDKAAPGMPTKVVRYWRATSTTLPPVATLFGEHEAVEAHSPLLDQLPQYLAARHISVSALKGYVIRDEYNLIIPSTASPGPHSISVSSISNRMLTIVLDPPDDAQLLPRELPLGKIEVENASPGQPPDPLHLTAPGPVQGYLIK